ncbi:hypothetical protein B9Z55_026833 [Caenorhabditis nigoni]|uniref:F-box domain-containing protein n=1 Tax=Caenorhabditis nigoni TaxID=1611254 RepID=A0A2G5SHR7_9PELO|nr:hypothetical protein B9Z55_026833 [Caenorhabditis nigoni]
MEIPPPNLLTIAEVPMTRITEFCDLKSILNLRKVCHDLRNFIDDTKPKISKIKVLGFEIFEDRIIFEIDDRTLTMDYKDDKKGNTVFSMDQKSKILENSNFFEIFSNDFCGFLDFQGPKFERIYMDLSKMSPNSLKKFLEVFVENLKKRKEKIKVKFLPLVLLDQEDSLEILKVLDSKFLKKIQIYFENFPENREEKSWKIDKIMELEQWKNLEKLVLHSKIEISDFRNLGHLRKCVLRVAKITVEDLKILKEVSFF